MLSLFSNDLPPAEALVLFYRIAAILFVVTIVIVGYSFWTAQRHPELRSAPSMDNDRFSVARQWLVYGLGILWLLDGFLQLQPLMVTRFIGGFLAPLISGQPAPVTWLINIGIKVWSLSPVVWNDGAAFIQIGIGLGLLLGHPERGQRRALWTSLVWGLIVWIAGEGLGGIFAGGGWLTGAPGSVLLYMVIALVLLAPITWWNRPSVNSWWRWAMVALFMLEALWQAWPAAGWWSASVSKGYLLSMAEMPQPQIFSSPIYAWATMVGHHPALWNGIITAGLVATAVMWVFWSTNRWVWGATMLWVFLAWWLGQDFGVLGGMGTDPNSGAVLILGLLSYAERTGIISLPMISRTRYPATKHDPA